MAKLIGLSCPVLESTAESNIRLIARCLANIFTDTLNQLDNSELVIGFNVDFTQAFGNSRDSNLTPINVIPGECSKCYSKFLEQFSTWIKVVYPGWCEMYGITEVVSVSVIHNDVFQIIGKSYIGCLYFGIVHVDNLISDITGV